MPQRSPNEVSAGGVLARPANDGWQVCLVRAGQHWGLPKGHVEPGETARSAAIREISEECGVDPTSLSLVAELPESEYVYRRGGRLIFKLVHHFLVVTGPGTAVTPQPGEIDATEWLTIDAALVRCSFADTRTALQTARGILDAGFPS